MNLHAKIAKVAFSKKTMTVTLEADLRGEFVEELARLQGLGLVDTTFTPLQLSLGDMNQGLDIVGAAEEVDPLCTCGHIETVHRRDGVGACMATLENSTTCPCTAFDEAEEPDADNDAATEAAQHEE